MQITKELIDLAISLNACSEGVERAKLGFEFLTLSDRLWISSQKETPVSFLEQLSTDENYLVRCYVACNPSTPAAILEKLSDEEIRMNVVKNPSTNLLTLHKMLQAELTAIGQMGRKLLDFQKVRG